MIWYDLTKMTKEEYKLILEKHSFTPNLDKNILELFVKTKELFFKCKENEKNLREQGVDRHEAKKTSRIEFPFRAVEDELAKQIKIKEKSSLKQSKAKKDREWLKGFDKFGRYKN